MFFMITTGDIIMIGVKHNLKDTNISNFLSLLLILHSTESISNKLGNELGILKLLEFKKNSEPISFCFYTGAQSV